VDRINMRKHAKYDRLNGLGSPFGVETDDFDDYDDEWPGRMPNSALHYQNLADVHTEVGRSRADAQPFLGQRSQRSLYTELESSIPPRRSATHTNLPAVQVRRGRVVRVNDGIHDTEELVSYRFRPHWLVFVGVAMLVMVMGWVVFTAAASWWQTTQDDWHYGRPRTFQTNVIVGHNDSLTNPSHFIALNLNRHVEVIEFPGGDGTKARIFIGPTLIGDRQDLAPVTLTFKDVNADGKLDMIINIQDSHFVFVNDHGTFRAARANENIHL
jgi:hypothetical protein